jgi:superfamily II DNA or RNA helicase
MTALSASFCRTSSSYVTRIGYQQALADHIVSPFRVALVGLRFAPSEQADYDEFGRRLNKHLQQLVDSFGFPTVRSQPEQWGMFLKKAGILARGAGQGAQTARLFMNAFSKRRKLLAETRAKIEFTGRLAPVVTESNRAILFTQTTDGAMEIARRLVRQGVPAAALYSGTETDARDVTLNAFQAGQLKAIAAPRLLDEGVNVPAADLAVVLAASRSRRQMIQRMGRVIRPKSDGRTARFVITFVKGTSEDPALGAHETFLNEVLQYAVDSRAFDAEFDISALLQYLRPVPNPSP